jgi:LPXTG-site transpeptidase (sortase) family protein
VRRRHSVALVLALGGGTLLLGTGQGRHEATRGQEPRAQHLSERQPASEAARRSAALRPRSRLSSLERFAYGGEIARLEIPAIELKAPVIRLGLNADGALQVPGRADQAGWWSGGAFPGAPGTAVIAGHVDSERGPAIFFRLRDVKQGDQIEIAPTRGRRARFVVDRVEQHRKNRFPTRAVYRKTARPSLRLITCSGAFDERRGRYPSNLIVFASAPRSAAPSTGE